MKKPLVIILLSILLIIAALSIYLSVKLEDIILYSISKSTDITITCQDFKIRIFKGFTLKKAQILFPQDSLLQSVDKIDLSYSFRELFKRKIKITGLRIVAPDIDLLQFPDGSWNFSPLIKKAPADTIPQKLPVIFEISNILIENLRLQAQTNIAQIELKSAIIKTNNLHYNSLKDFSASIQGNNLIFNLISPNPPLDFIMQTNFSAVLDQDSLILTMNSRCSAKLSQLDLKSYCLDLQAAASFSRRSIDVPLIHLSSADPSNLTLNSSLKVENILSQPHFAGSVELQKLNLQYFLNILKLNSLHIGKTAFPQYGNISFEGACDLIEKKYSLSLELQQSLQLEQISLSQPPLYISALDNQISLQALIDNHSLSLHSFSLDLNSHNLTSPLLQPFNVMLEDASANLLKKDHNYLLTSSLTLNDSSRINTFVKSHLPENLLNFQPSLDFLDSLALQIENLPLISFTDSSVSAALFASASLNNQGKNTFRFQSNFNLPDSLTLLKSIPHITIPIDTIFSQGAITLPADFLSVLLDSVIFYISDDLELLFNSTIDRYSAHTIITSAAINLSNLYHKFPFLCEKYPLEFNALLHTSGEAFLDFNHYLNSEIDLHASLTPFNLNYLDYSAKNIAASFDLAFQQDSLFLFADLAIDTVTLPVLRAKPLTGIDFNFDAKLSADSLNFNSYFNCLLSSEKTQINASAYGGFIQGRPQFAGKMTIAFASSDSLEIIDRQFLQGACDLVLDYRIHDSAFFNGYINLKNLNFFAPAYAFNGAGGKMKFDQQLSLHPFSPAKSDLTLDPFYQQNLPYLRNIYNDSSHIFISRLKAADWELSGIQADAQWKNSALQIDNFQLDFFGGNMSGSGWLKIDSLNTAEFSYHLAAAAAEINSALLTKTSQQHDQSSNVSFNMNLIGKQFSPLDETFDIEGNFNLTKISPKVAENLLIFLDPRQEDKGIQSMLYFLRRGWGIKSFSFEISHGFVYSTILTQKPPVAKPFSFFVSRVVPIEKDIKLSRLPIKFFLKR